MRRSVLDLPASKVRAVEERVKAPLDEWGSVNRGALLPALVEAFGLMSYAEADAKSLRELLELVSLDTDDEPGNGNGPASHKRQG
jgi:hypothetical protein